MTYPIMTPYVSIIRVYETFDGYDKRAPYIAVVTVTHLTKDLSYLSGGLGELSRDTWKKILELLKNNGSKQVMLERHGKIKTINL